MSGTRTPRWWPPCAQAERYLHTCFNIVMYPGYIELAEALIDLVPGDWPKKVMLQTTGAEAVENAIKVARRATGRQAVVAFENAFHGRTYMALSLTAKAPAYKSGFGPFANEVYRAPFPVRYRSGLTDEACARAAFEQFRRLVESEITPGQVAAVIIEPIQGEGGFHVAPPAFLQSLREYCSRHGIVLIADEIQSGFCRSGEWFATQHAGVQADLYTLAKSMGAGLPIAALVGRADLMDAPAVGGLGGTYGGNPLACAAALAAIQVMRRDDYAARARDVGGACARTAAALRHCWRRARAGRHGRVRGGARSSGSRARRGPGRAYRAGRVPRRLDPGESGLSRQCDPVPGAAVHRRRRAGRGLDILERAVAQAQDLADAGAARAA